MHIFFENCFFSKTTVFKLSYANLFKNNSFYNELCAAFFFENNSFYNEFCYILSKTAVFTINFTILRRFWHRAGPVAEPSRAEPSRALPSRAEPSRAEIRADSSRAEPNRADSSRFEPSRAKPSQAEPNRRRPTRHMVQKHKFLQRFLHFYTLFKNSSFYNEFGYFAIEVSVFTMNLSTCLFVLHLSSNYTVFTINSAYFSTTTVFYTTFYTFF